MTCFETATRVPFILRAPRKPASAGQVSAELVELVDLYRTLADLAGLPSPPATPAGRPDDHSSVQGKSLVPVLDQFGGGPALDRTAFPGVALSQMTRCASGVTDFGAEKYYPCLSNAAPLPDVRRAYDFMGYSVRSATWRLTMWFPWNRTTLCPEWEREHTTMRELYDHRGDSALYDVENFENENVAADPAHRAVLANLSAVIHGAFGEGCPH